MPVDCDNGYERVSGVPCEIACDGDCCVSPPTREGIRDDSALYERPCTGFTGLIYKDGSCFGQLSCRHATIAEVKGPSCTGKNACSFSTSTLVKDSCNGYDNGYDEACYKVGVGLIEGSCNERGDCSFEIHATSIVNGEVSGEYDPREICRDECKSSREEGGFEAYDDCRRECDYL